jgi:hypothetical protein
MGKSMPMKPKGPISAEALEELESNKKKSTKPDLLRLPVYQIDLVGADKTWKELASTHTIGIKQGPGKSTIGALKTFSKGEARQVFIALEEAFGQPVEEKQDNGSAARTTKKRKRDDVVTDLDAIEQLFGRSLPKRPRKDAKTKTPMELEGSDQEDDVSIVTDTN